MKQKVDAAEARPPENGRGGNILTQCQNNVIVWMMTSCQNIAAARSKTGQEPL